jgi:hypothetical protein
MSMNARITVDLPPLGDYAYSVSVDQECASDDLEKEINDIAMKLGGLIPLPSHPTTHRANQAAGEAIAEIWKGEANRRLLGFREWDIKWGDDGTWTAGLASIGFGYGNTPRAAWNNLMTSIARKLGRNEEWDCDLSREMVEAILAGMETF